MPVQPRSVGRQGRRVWTRRRNWLLNLAVVAVALVIVFVGVGALSLRTMVTAALIFGVPLALALITATVVLRRSR